MSLDSSAIEADLKKALRRYGPRGDFEEVYGYALFPTGKLFRPKLVWALGLDDGVVTENHRLFAVSIEFHHTYTLLHDDLPCMDNDLMRRGRPSTHVHFNEWKALLAADGLINLSYRVLSEVTHQRSRILLKIFSHCLGPKGLVLGQYKDLSTRKKVSLGRLLNIHELKTARLIQCALIGGRLLGKNPMTYREGLDLAKLGRCLGIFFQLLDDLSEFSENCPEDLGDAANPWACDFDCYLNECRKCLQVISLKMEGRTHLGEMVREHFQMTLLMLEKDKKVIEERIGQNLSELLGLLGKFS